MLFRCSDSLPTGEGWGEASFTVAKIQNYFLNSKKRAVYMCEHPLNLILLTVKLYKTTSNASISPHSPAKRRLLPCETLHLGLRNITSYDAKHQHLRCLTIAQLRGRSVTLLRCYSSREGYSYSQILLYIYIYYNIYKYKYYF